MVTANVIDNGPVNIPTCRVVRRWSGQCSWMYVHGYSTSCVCSFIGHWMDSHQTTSPSWYSLSPQDIQACGQPTRTPCLTHEHHWSLWSGRSVLLVPQLGTAFRPTLRP